MTGIPGRFEVAVAALVLVGGLLLALFVGRKPSQSARRKLPPGPRGWPVLGSLPLLSTLPHRSLYDLSKKYGPLMLMHLGSVRILVVTSPKFSEEILKTHEKITSSRPDLIVARHATYNANDIAFAPYGKHWRHMRKVCTLGLLTARRISEFQDIRQREAMAAVQFILEESQRGNAVNMFECFSTITSNNITQMIMSQSYCVPKSGSSSALSTMSTWLPKAFNEMTELVGAFNLADYIPLLKPFDPQGLHKRIKVVRRRLDKFLDGVIVERRQRRSIETAENHRADFVDVLLGFGQTLELGEPLSMNEVKATLFDMIAGGSDSSSVAGLWALTELLKHPHVLRRVQGELDSVVGPNRLVQEEDLSKLHYLNAVVKETLRLHPPAPLVSRETTEDCEIEGFHIPARTRVFINVWGMHRDPAVWERPLEFDPDRFLNSSTDFKGLDFDFLPFGSGRRIYPGMNLGSLMVVYPLALLLHALDWGLLDGQNPEEQDMSEIFGLVLHKRLPLRVFGKARLPHDVLYPVSCAGIQMPCPRTKS